MQSGIFNRLVARARERARLTAASGALIAVVIPASVVLLAFAGAPRPSGSGQPRYDRDPVAVAPVAQDPSPSPVPVVAATAVPPPPVQLPFLGLGAAGPAGPAIAPRPGSLVSVPEVGLRIGVVDYTDCSGNTPMTRSSAVHFMCTSKSVPTLMGHNPGVFTPLTRARGGEHVHYQHDGIDQVFVISEIHRVAPDQAAAYSQDDSYPHAVLATCAEPDSSAYWVFIAVPEGSLQTASTRQPTPAPASQSDNPGSASRPTPSPTPAGTTLPGGITLPPPPR